MRVTKHPKIEQLVKELEEWCAILARVEAVMLDAVKVLSEVNKRVGRRKIFRSLPKRAKP